jgi:hypothetical protein
MAVLLLVQGRVVGLQQPCLLGLVKARGREAVMMVEGMVMV